MYLSEIRTVVVEIPKCASTSLLAVLPSVYSVSLEARHFTLKQHEGRGIDIDVGTALIREPIDRLVSAANFSVFRRSPGSSLAEFRDKLMRSLDAGKPNVEVDAFYPQYSFLISDIAIRLYTLENFSVFLCDLGIHSSPPVRNVVAAKISRAEVIDVFGRDFVNDFYSLDFALYDSVRSIGEGALRARSAREHLMSLR